jgi:HD-like signal output (HDOD) protein
MSLTDQTGLDPALANRTIMEPAVAKAKAIAALSDLPPFPVVLNRLLASLAEEDVPFAKIGDLIEKDTVISGNVLRMVNSALYARRGTVNSVRHALSLIGVEKVRNVVLGMSITRLWSKIHTPGSWSTARFNKHSAEVAALSDCLVQRLPVNYGEGAFVGGLLHDVGRLLIALSLTPQHDAIAELHQRTGRPICDCESELLGFTHGELSADALISWNIPAPICTAVLYHHRPSADTSEIGAGEVRLSRIVSVADEYVNSIGESILPRAVAGRRPDPALIESLGLDHEQAEALLEEFSTEREVMSEFFR